MRDFQHYIMSTIILLASITLSFFVFQYAAYFQTTEVAAVTAFVAGISIIILYQVGNHKNLKHKISKINNLTQVWLGAIIIIAALITLFLNLYLGVEFSTALIWMSGVVLVLFFLSITKFDEFLEKKLKLT